MKYDLAIIVAAYNVEEYISECIDSYLNNEIINSVLVIVNDGSSDNTNLILSEYKLHDNIKILEKKNGGLSSARNYGIKYIRDYAKYISFLDADDYISSDYISFFKKVTKNYSPDIIEFNMIRFGGISDKVIYSSLSYDGFYYLDDEFTHKVLAHGLWFSVSRIYSSELFVDKLFTEGRHYEDVILIPLLYLNASKVYSSSESFYFYRDNPNGITRNASLKHIDDIFFAYENFKINCCKESLLDAYSKSTYNTLNYVLSNAESFFPKEILYRSSETFNINILRVVVNYVVSKIKKKSKDLIKRVYFEFFK